MAERPGATLRLVVGFVADKDVDHILPMFPTQAVYYVTQAQIPRALDWQTLLKMCREHGLDATGYAEVSEALEAARRDARPDDIIYIGGSTFIVADALAVLKK